MRRKAVRNTLAQTFGLLANFAERVVVVALLVRLWGTDAFASWSAILAVTSMVSIAELSLNVHFGNRWQKLHSAGESEEFRRLLGVSLTIYASLCILLAVASWLAVAIAGEHLVDLLKVEAFNAREATVVFGLLVLAQIFQISSGSVSQVFRGRGDFALGQVTDVVVNLATALAAVATLLFGGGPVELALTYLFMQAILRWGVILIFLRSAYPDLKPVFAPPRRADFADILGSLRWLSLIQVSSVLMVHAPVVLLVQLGAPSAAVVSFVTARTLVNLARTFGQFAAIGLSVEIATCIHVSGWTKAWPAIRNGARFLQTAVAVGTGGLLAFSVPIIHLWTGNANLHNAATFAALCLPLALAGGFSVLQNSLIYVDEKRRFALLWAFLLGASMAAGLIGYQVYGAPGFAMGLALAELAALSLLLPVLGRGLMPAAASWRARMMALGAVATAVGYLGGVACLYVFGSEGWHLAASGSLWAITIAAPVLLFAVPRTMRLAVLGRLRLAAT